jgi:hypothetical protein
MMATNKDPLAPIEFVTTLVSAAIVLVLALTVPATIFGSGSFLGIGESDVCVTTPMKGFPVTDAVGNDAGIVGVRKGVDGLAETIRLCSGSAGGGARALQTLVIGSGFFFLLGFVLLMRWLLKSARRGLFTAEVARRTLTLGWYLLVGELVRACCDAFGRAGILHQFVDHYSVGNAGMLFHASVATLIAGFGLITLGRVMGQTVPMREDIEATI